MMNRRLFRSFPDTMQSCIRINETNISEFINSFDNVLTDCDGVIWRAKKSIPGSCETLQKLREMGKRVFYVTNNSMETRTEFVKKCETLGFEAKMDEIYCTANAIAGYLQKLKFDKTAYIIGCNGIGEELDAVGIKNIGIGPDVLNTDLISYIFKDVKLLPDVGAVVVGLDPHFSYPKLLKATSYLNDPNCLFIASNLDDRFPMTESSIIVPGTGAVVVSVKMASQREPIVIGKPNTGMFEAIVHQHGLDPSRTIMIGDRLDTDILFGTNCGLRTLLVLTGVTSLDDVKAIQENGSEEDKWLIPSFYVQRLGNLAELMNGVF